MDKLTRRQLWGLVDLASARWKKTRDLKVWKLRDKLIVTIWSK
jgi:hypothetical protein